MIKTTIIIILILLLFITLYSYYCISSKMIEFERKRLEFILNKEIELRNLEKKIKIIQNCSNKNLKYQQAIKNINNIIDNLDLTPEPNLYTETESENINNINNTSNTNEIINNNEIINTNDINNIIQEETTKFNIKEMINNIIN